MHEGCQEAKHNKVPYKSAVRTGCRPHVCNKAVFSLAWKITDAVELSRGLALFFDVTNFMMVAK